MPENSPKKPAAILLDSKLVEQATQTWLCQKTPPKKPSTILLDSKLVEQATQAEALARQAREEGSAILLDSKLVEQATQNWVETNTLIHRQTKTRRGVIKK